MAKPDDYDIANDSGAAVREDLNDVLSAIVSLNADTSEPNTTYAYMLWADIGGSQNTPPDSVAANKLRMRNGSNSAWIEVGDLDQTGLNIVGAKFPNLTSSVSATAPELNILDGATLTTAELNILDGATLTTDNLNLLSGVNANVQTAHLNKMGSITAGYDEINVVDMSESASTAGQVLTSNGTTSVPTWQTLHNAIVQMETVQSRAQTQYTVHATNDHPDGVEIAELTMTLTPRKSGNKMILDWNVSYEDHAAGKIGFIVTRNGTLLDNSGGQSDGTRNRWDVVAVGAWDGNTNSTPVQSHIRIVDESTLAVSSVYRVHIVPTGTDSVTFKLNRTWTSAGANLYENTLSTGVATEINVV